MTEIAFQRLLQSVLFDNKYDRYVSNRRSGKLDTKKLRKISYSDKLFKKREERKNKNYSIALVVDCSGSMSGPKSDFAFKAAQSLSKNLSAAKINHAVYAFNAVTDIIKAWDTSYDRQIEEKLERMLHYQKGFWFSEDSYSERYEFVGKLWQFVPKFKELPRPARYTASDGAGDNNDPHALKHIAKEIRKQEGTKVMIVLSDGQPAPSCEEYQIPDFPKFTFGENELDLKHEVNEIIKSGIELHSIGIMTDAVNDYYPPSRTCAIYELGDLYDHIIKIIRLNMKRT